MKMNIGIGKFVCSKTQPATRNFFWKSLFYVGGVDEGMEKAGSLFGGPAFFCIQIPNLFQ